ALSLCCTALEIGTLLDRERFMSNIANHMCLGLKHNVAALDWPFHSTVHNHPLSSDASDDLGTCRDDQRSAMHITFDLAIDLNQPFGADIAHDFEPAADDSSATHYSEHDTLPGLRTTPVKASIQAGRNFISLKTL